jgi:hypothetical protein
MPETPYAAALEVARKLPTGVSHTAFKAGNKSIRVTASFGLCGMDRVPRGDSELAERRPPLLAKQRNRVGCPDR